MRKQIALWLTLAAIIVSGSLVAQTYDLSADYGINKDRAGSLNDYYTIQEARQKFDAFYGFCMYDGWTDEMFMQVIEHTAAWNDAIWKGEFPLDYSNGCQSRSNIIAPPGKYPCRYHKLIAHGNYKGHGSSKYYDNQGGTEYYVDHENWIKGDRNIFQSIAWGDNTTFGYVEDMQLEGFRLEGSAGKDCHDTSYHSSGVAIWDMGETGRIVHVEADRFNNYGFELVRGTPNSLLQCSAFQNGLAGYGFIGTDLATSNSSTVSGDDQPFLVAIKAGYGRPAGGTFVFTLSKSETGKRGDRAQGIAWLEGAFNAIFNGVWLSSEFGAIDAAFVIDNRIGGVEQNAMLTVNNFKGYNYKTLVQSIGQGLRWPSVGDYMPVNFVWHSTLDAKFGHSMPSAPDVCNCDDRLGFQTEWNSAGFLPFDYEACTPTYIWECDGIVVPPDTMPPPIAPSNYTIIINDQDPTSEAIATDYQRVFGAAKVLRMALGTANNTNTVPDRSQIEGKYCILAFRYPSRVNNCNSITFAMSYGYDPSGCQNQFAADVPYPEIPAFMVYNTSMIEIAEVAQLSDPIGTYYLNCANDQGGQPRGNARCNVDENVLTKFDNRLGCSGECAGNNIKNKTDMLGCFLSMYKYDVSTNNVMPGAVGDAVTSTAGNLPTGLGQTPITHFVENGFVGTTGTIVEPWEPSSDGNLREQFIDPDVFIPLYNSGTELGEALYRSVKHPQRSLFIAIPHCQPFTGNLPPPISGCMDPDCSNYNPLATVDDGSCTGCTTGPIEWVTMFDFEDGNASYLTGDPLDAKADKSWSIGRISNGVMFIENGNAKYNISYPNGIEKEATSITLEGCTFTSFGWGFVCNDVKIAPDGFVWINNTPTTQQLLLNVKGDYNIQFPSGFFVRKLFGHGTAWNSQRMEVDGIVIR